MGKYSAQYQIGISDQQRLHFAAELPRVKPKAKHAGASNAIPSGFEIYLNYYILSICFIRDALLQGKPCLVLSREHSTASQVPDLGPSIRIRQFVLSFRARPLSFLVAHCRVEGLSLPSPFALPGHRPAATMHMNLLAPSSFSSGPHTRKGNKKKRRTAMRDLFLGCGGGGTKKEVASAFWLGPGQTLGSFLHLSDFFFWLASLAWFP